MELELFKSYKLSDHSHCITIIKKDSGHTTLRTDAGGMYWIQSGLTSFIETQVEKELIEPDFDFHHLSLLEAMEICKDPDRPEELRYMYNIDDKQWYYLSASGQFHRYSKVPCEDKYYWVTTEITLELIKGIRWCVPNTICGYVPLDTEEYTYHNFA